MGFASWLMTICGGRSGLRLGAPLAKCATCGSEIAACSRRSGMCRRPSAPLPLLGGYCFPASFVAFSQFVITWIAGAAVSVATVTRKRWPSGLGAYVHVLLSSK